MASWNSSSQPQTSTGSSSTAPLSFPGPIVLSHEQWEELEVRRLRSLNMSLSPDSFPEPPVLSSEQKLELRLKRLQEAYNTVHWHGRRLSNYAHELNAKLSAKELEVIEQKKIQQDAWKDVEYAVAEKNDLVEELQSMTEELVGYQQDLHSTTQELTILEHRFSILLEYYHKFYNDIQELKHVAATLRAKNHALRAEKDQELDRLRQELERERFKVRRLENKSDGEVEGVEGREKIVGS